MPVYSERDVRTSTSTSDSAAVETTSASDIMETLGNEALQELFAADLGADLQADVLDGGVIRNGDQGVAVQQLQEALGFSHADGVFGPLTEGSVIRLQQALGLTGTGVVDVGTLMALAEIRNSSSIDAILFRHQSKGSSAATASQVGMSGGADASVAMANEDEQRLLPYIELFEDIGAEYDVPPAVLMAIASRESRGGALLDADGFSIYDGQGYGLMQVDRNHHDPVGDPFGRAHIEQAAGILVEVRTYIERKYPDWTASEQLRGAICAYNTGPSGIRTVEGMDRGTTGKDYSGDVWVRAQRYARLFQLQSS